MSKFKISFFIVSFIFFTNANAQIQIEKRYDKYIPTNIKKHQSVEYKLEVNATGYENEFVWVSYKIDNSKNYNLDEIIIYNINHSIRSEINLKEKYADYSISTIKIQNNQIFPVTSQLFNTNEKLEILFQIKKGNERYLVLIDEEGNEIQRIKADVKTNRYVLYNLNENGVRLKSDYSHHSSTNNGYSYAGYVSKPIEATIYKFDGKLPSSTLYNNPVLRNTNNMGVLGNFIPNPARNTTKIYYELPKGIEKGTFHLYYINGQEIKKYIVGKGFEFLELTIGELPSGTYLGKLICNGKSIGSKKLIIVK
jgi:hypothetical protein